MLQPPRKWGIPSPEEVKSIKDRILHLERKIEEGNRLHRSANAPIKKWRREVMRNKAYIAPARRLNSELLSEIFIICCHTEPSAHSRISAVCHRWRQTILATPFSWTRINPYSNGPKSPASLLAYVTTFLQRSHPRPLDVTLSGHPVACIRHGSSQQSRSPLEWGCACDVVEKIDEHTDRIQRLQMDPQRTSIFFTKSFPQLERLIIPGRMTSTVWLDSTRLPKLWYLDVGVIGNHESTGTEALELASIPHPRLRLRHISVATDRTGYWQNLIHLHSATLKTLKIVTKFPKATTTREDPMIPDCPVLERIMVDDRYQDNSDGLPERMGIKAPNLKFYQYYSMNSNVRLAHDTDFNKVLQLRTDDRLIPLSFYRHLRILQLYYNPDLVLDIVKQLEEDDSLCPELSVIEIRNGTHRVAKWVDNHGNTIHDRLFTRYTSANSHIELLIKSHQNRWEYSLPEDDEIFEHGLPLFVRE